MEETFLYRQIAEIIRKQILSGERKPGDRLPPVRAMAAQWNCTIGTIQRAYQELARQKLVNSRSGQGTHVVERLPSQDETPLRRAALVNRAESFLLEVLTAGYSTSEVEDAVRQALDRWRVVGQTSATPAALEVRFNGSHDPAVAWLASHFPEIAPGYRLKPEFSGSRGGLIALAEGKCELAGCHLWDEQSNSYNLPFVRHLMPETRVVLVTLADRRLGLIVPPGNPARIHVLPDLARPGLRFVNRQPGSGTRVWLDTQLHHLGISPLKIQGYALEKMTHFEVANSVLNQEADTGIGLEFAALSYGLGFIPLTLERYQLACLAASLELPAIHSLVEWLKSDLGKGAIGQLAGYSVAETGSITWVN